MICSVFELLVSYEHKTWKLPHFTRSVLMVSKLAMVLKKKIDRTDSIRFIYRGDFATRGMSFKFAKKTWLQDLGKNLDYFLVPTLCA